MKYLSQEQVDQYHQDGYLVVPEYLTQIEIAAARKRALEIVEDFNMEQVYVFSTTDHGKTSDAYFIESGDKICCFFEEEAFDEQGLLKRPKDRSINKIGHALHDLDEAFMHISYKPELPGISRQLGIADPMIVQSQYIFKQPGIGGKVSPHRDSTFIYTSPPTCTGFWMALEDATMENGCLMAVPGSHAEVLPSTICDLQSRRFVRNADGKSTKFLGGSAPEWDIDKMVPLEVKRGSLVVLHGSLVHMSMPNRSEHSRQAYILHMVEADAAWASDNWLQRPADFPFRKLLDVVGIDGLKSED